MAQIALRKYTAEIADLVEHGHIDEAIAHCRTILQTYPRHVETYRLLGKAYLEAQRYSDATDILQRVLSSVPDDFIAHVGMSIVREDEGNLDAAVWHMERAFEVNPSNQAIQGELRRLYGRRDGAPPAKIRLTRGALARMYAHGDLYQQATSELQAALTEDPKRPDLEVVLAEMHYLAEKPAEAADAASKLTAKLPHCLQANRLLTILLTQANRPEEQITVFRDRWYSLEPYAGALNELVDDPDLLRDDAVLVNHLEYDGSGAQLPSQPGWASSLGVNLEAEAEPEADWLGDFGSPAATEAGLFENDPAEEGQSLSRMFTDDLDPDEPGLRQESDPLSWMEAESAGSTGEAEEEDWLSSAASGAVAATEGALFDDEADDDLAFQNDMDDVRDIIDPTRPNPADSDTGGSDLTWLDEPAPSPSPSDDDDEEMSWLDGLAGEVQDEMSAQAEPAPSAEPAAESEEDLSWLDSAAEESQEMAASPPAAEGSTDDDDMAWLDDIAGEVQDDMAADSPTPAKSTEDEEDMPWLSGLSEEVQAEMSAESEAAPEAELPDFLTEAGWEEGSGEELPTSIFDEDDHADPPTPAAESPSQAAPGEVPDWVKDLAPQEDEIKAKEAELLADQPMEWLDEAKSSVGEDAPDWLSDFSTDRSDAPVPLPDAGEGLSTDLSWLDDIGDQAKEEFAAENAIEEAPAEAENDAEEMAWLDDLTGEVQDQMAAESQIADPDLTPPLDDKTIMDRLTEAEPQAESSEEDMNWLDDLADEVQEEMAAESPASESGELPAIGDETLGQRLPDLPRSEIPGSDDGEDLSWLEDLGAQNSSEATADPLADEDLAWLDQIVGGETDSEPESQPAAKAAPVAESLDSAADDEDMSWLDDLSDEVQEEMADEITEHAAAEPVAETPALEDEDQADMDWVGEIATDANAEDTLVRARVPLNPSPVVDDLSWLDQIERETKGLGGVPSTSPDKERAQKIAAQKETETGSAEPVEIDDDSMGWLEGLAAKAGADEDEMTTAPEDRSEDTPGWLSGVDPEDPIDDSVEEQEIDLDASLPPGQTVPEWLQNVDDAPDADSKAAPHPEWLPDVPGEPRPSRSSDWEPENLDPPEAPAPEPVSEPAAKPSKAAAQTAELLAGAAAALEANDHERLLAYYTKLIASGRQVPDIIASIKEALRKHPVDVKLWEILGDAYMKDGQLQEAMDSYTKAEDLVR